MLDLSPASEEDCIWNFGVAEMESPRDSGLGYIMRLSARCMDRIRAANRWQDLSESDRRELRDAVLSKRGNIVRPLLRQCTGWWYASLPLSEVGQVRLMSHQPFLRLAGSGKLEDFVVALDRGELPPGDEDFGLNYQQVRAAFDPTKIRGVPVLVSRSIDGPWIGAEGLTRLSIWTSKHSKGEAADSAIHVLLGVCPGIAEWPYDRWDA